MTSKSREEIYLNAIIGNGDTVPTPRARIELFLQKIFAGQSDVPTPVTRAELFLSKIAGNNVDIPTPQTRVEMYLAKIAGEDIEVPVPVTRVEWFLNEWANGASPRVLTTVTGTTPLTLANAIASSIKSLVQYGKVTTSNGDMYCNNGKLVAVDDELPSGYERQIGFEFAASTYYLISGFHLRGSDTVRLSFSADKACNVFGCYTTNSAADNYSLYASTSSGGKHLRYDGATYNSYIPSAQVGERIDVIITPTGTSGMPTDSVITPAEFEATADLCIGTTSTSASSSKLDGSIWGNFVVDGRLTLIPCKRLSDDALGYYDLDSDTFYEPVGSAPTSLGVDASHLTELSVVGTPEVLTIGEQAATVENLLAVDDIADEHNIISGAVTRRCEAVISDGTTPSGRYIGEVGEGNIIVKVRETGYEGDVATFEADRAKPLNGLTVNVEPIQAGTGDPSPDNVRPISGRTSATIYRSGADTSNPTTYTIALGDTVYGGKLDVTGGKMVVDRTKFSPTVNYLQSVNSYGIANFRGTFYEKNTPYAKNNNLSKENFKCNCLPTQMTVIANTQNSGVSLSNRETFYIRLPETEAATVEAANAWISAHNLEICYMLESPVEITLTPAQIETLIGMNNIWSDAGAVKAYVADAELIEHVTAQPMQTIEGNNTVAVTSEIGNVDLSVEYYIPKSE